MPDKKWNRTIRFVLQKGILLVLGRMIRVSSTGGREGSFDHHVKVIWA